MPYLYLPFGRVMQLILRDADDNDVTVLDIGGPDMGGQGICLLSGWSGLIHAPRTPTRESWAYQEGSTPSDFPRVDERLIDLRLGTKGNSPVEWETIDSLLWQVLGFRHDAYLRVYSADEVSWRELKVRLDRKPNDATTFDTAVLNHMVWQITLVATDPWWYSETLEVTWTKGSDPTILLENPADQECWVEWSGPEITVAETWTLPDAGGKYPANHAQAGEYVTHTLPALGVGQEFMVQTHPLLETLEVRSGGSGPWAQMRAEDFSYSLKPGQEPIALPIGVTGGTESTQVTAFLTQRWDKPFGQGAYDLPIAG